MRPLSNKTVLRLMQIRRKILAYPQQFMMTKWFVMKETIPRCKTAACIAGWALTLKKHGNPKQAASQFKIFKDIGYVSGISVNEDVETKARVFLGLTKKQALKLFYRPNWPVKFQPRIAIEGTTEYAQEAADRIIHFIDSHGKE